MAFLSSFNFFALIVGYIALFFVIVIILFFLWILLKDKYADRKRQKEYKLMQKQKEQEERQKNIITKEAPKEAAKENLSPQSQQTNKN